MKHSLSKIEKNPENYKFCKCDNGLCEVINFHENKSCFRCGSTLRNAGDLNFNGDLEENEVQAVVDFLRADGQTNVEV